MEAKLKVVIRQFSGNSQSMGAFYVHDYHGRKNHAAHSRR